MPINCHSGRDPIAVNKQAGRSISLYTRPFARLTAPPASGPLKQTKDIKADEAEFELCTRLEERGVACWIQGEGLLDAHSPNRASKSSAADPFPTRSLVCAGESAEVLAALPHAVVTASEARRLTVASPAGPIDLLPAGRRDPEKVFIDFGLSPLAFGFRPTRGEWCDPIGGRAAFAQSILSPTTTDPNPFLIAPRRYWIAARLLSKYALAPSDELLEAARTALPEALEILPEAAPARREVSRILGSNTPETGLAFLRESGLSQALFPGIRPEGERQVAQLPKRPALRWAAWLDGAAIQRALVRFRVPHALSRRIERIHASHPIDRRVESMREVGLRKILGRLDEDEIEGLFAWRRLEMSSDPQTTAAQDQQKRLDELEVRFKALRDHRERNGLVRTLALDGRAVMTALAAGPGPHVGRALAHLANFVEAHPESNEREALEEELRTWAAHN